jgi:hypothetical protein
MTRGSFAFHLSCCLGGSIRSLNRWCEKAVFKTCGYPAKENFTVGKNIGQCRVRGGSSSRAISGLGYFLTEILGSKVRSSGEFSYSMDLLQRANMSLAGNLTGRTKMAEVVARADSDTLSEGFSNGDPGR